MSKRPKWHVMHENLKAGDVVLIKGLVPKMKRWPLGVIEQAIPNKDGFVRKVTIRTLSKYLQDEVGLPTQNGDHPKCRNIVRPINHLVLLPSDEEATTEINTNFKMLTIMKGGLHEESKNTKNFTNIEKTNVEKTKKPD